MRLQKTNSQCLHPQRLPQIMMRPLRTKRRKTMLRRKVGVSQRSQRVEDSTTTRITLKRPMKINETERRLVRRRGRTTQSSCRGQSTTFEAVMKWLRVKMLFHNHKVDLSNPKQQSHNNNYNSNNSRGPREAVQLSKFSKFVEAKNLKVHLNGQK